MIRPADGSVIRGVRADDAFYTRVLSLYLCYGEYGFVDFWVQEAGDSAVALISRFEDKFSLYLTSDSDLDEIAAFLSFRGAGSAMFDASFKLPISGAVHTIEGDVLEYTGEDHNSELEIYIPDLADVYDTVRTCASDIFRVPDRLLFLSDLTRRNNSGRLSLMGAAVDGVLASSALTVSETDSAAILGAVATRPEYRRRGLSRELVRALATKLRADGKRVYVLSASEANTRFYKKSGFDISAGFKEIFLNE